MDAVVLAAGRGQRLQGLVPAFHKPLLIANGRPIVTSCVEHALLAGCEKAVVVVAPDNASVISQVLPVDDRVRIVLQRDAKGPGDALLLGLELCYDGQVLVQMGDNATSFSDVDRVASWALAARSFVVGAQTVVADDAERLTWYAPDQPTKWREKERPLGLQEVIAWVGPFRANKAAIRRAYKEYGPRWAHESSELPIGPVFNFLPDPTFVDVSTIDVGIPEMLYNG